MPKTLSLFADKFSGAGQQTENSIAYQVDTMKKFCAENGHEIVAEFADEAKSGTNIDRGDSKNA